MFRFVWTAGLAFYFSTGLSPAVASNEPTCPARELLVENEMNPEGINNYLQRNRSSIKSPGDFVCCLPTDIKSNYIIGHGSFAGQNGSKDQPRVILFSRLREAGGSKFSTKPMRYALSINSKGQGMHQSDSVEFMFDDQASGKLSYFDLDLSTSAERKLSEPNPTSCLSCHGGDNHVSQFGPRPLFEPVLSWDQFIKGRSCDDNLDREVERRVEKAMKADSSYRCLSPKVDGVSPFQPDGVRPSFIISDFDTATDIFNHRRVAKILSESTDFDRYQFAIAGALICDGGFPIESWVPPKALANHTNESSLLPEIRGQSFEKALAFSKDALLKKAKERKEFEQQLKKALPQDPFSPEVIDNCRAKFVENKVASLQAMRTPKSPSETLMSKFEMDTSLRSEVLEHQSTQLRFLIEGRGIPMGSWGMRIWPSYARALRTRLISFLAEENPHGELARITKTLRSEKFIPHYEIGQPSLMGAAFATRNKREASLIKDACAKLKTASIAALSGAKISPQAPTRLQRSVR